MALNVTNTTPYFKQALYIGEARITLAALWDAIEHCFWNRLGTSLGTFPLL